MSFQISATEALSLGFCIGRASRGLRFFEELQRHLRLVVPDLNYFSQWECWTPDLPSGLRRVVLDDGVTLAVHPEQKNVIYEIRDKMRTNVARWIPSRPRSLINLVFFSYGANMKLSRAERLIHNMAVSPGREDDWSTIVGLFSGKSATTAVSAFSSCGEDDAVELDRKFMESATASRVCEEYALGKIFGEADVAAWRGVDWIPSYPWSMWRESMEELVQRCDHVEFQEAHSEILFRCEIRQYAEPLLDSPLVQNSLYASGLIRRLLVDDISCSKLMAYFRFQENPDYHIDVIFDLMERRRYLSCAYGEILGVLRDRDAMFRLRQADSPEPRMLSAVVLNPDSVEELLDQTARAFDTPQFVPRDVVLRLGVVVEEMVSRVWPREAHELTVRELLRHKMRSTRVLEYRFAEVASPLYFAYRNKAYHVTSFDCSAREAHYFYAAVRALVDLWRRIEETRAVGDQ